MKISDTIIRARILSLTQAGPVGLSDIDVDAWRNTHALPVYSDLGGTLLLTPDGDVITYRHDNSSWSREIDPKWRRAAVIFGAQRFPELSDLLPVRPPDAPPCQYCQGTGRVVGIRCATCLGLGWVWSESV